MLFSVFGARRSQILRNSEEKLSCKKRPSLNRNVIPGQLYPEGFSEPCQKFEMELFVENT